MTDRDRGSADAIEHARDLLAPEDEQLSARLDDVERGATVADLDAVLAIMAGAMANPSRLRAAQYRKLAAVQAAARICRSELASRGAPGGPMSPGAPAAPSPPTPTPQAATGGGERTGSWLSRLARLRPGNGGRP